MTTHDEDHEVLPSLTPERGHHWGDEFRAAYLQAKRHFPKGVVTYQSVADRVSQLVPTSVTSVLRLGNKDTLPCTAPERQRAYLSLVAMGFDPEAFGLTAHDRALKGLTESEIRMMLDPAFVEVEEEYLDYG